MGGDREREPKLTNEEGGGRQRRFLCKWDLLSDSMMILLISLIMWPMSNFIGSLFKESNQEEHISLRESSQITAKK